MKLVKNKLGGINDLDASALKRAKETDLLTFDRDINGTNCYNCKWIKNKTQEHGYCGNPKVAQYVNNRMCCAVWDTNASYRPYK